ncbi:LysR substrate-binding domain-containing protein [Methylobacterium organophilum]|uniref:Glycine cleavage system transcriptional activator n=1 Tax=Methylobacterium organophilum TaxID=410 RepID=A0ABQ4TA53_METOR|nr:LysR substrate-binding domain-containing protein [Methylobacterium organophilum]UMY15840.1 LysR substrate-binding domain-containing protein [Methylobacterium organophilum]GJE28545.1 Glycine cleavage system transcriptional activator [Methylobacterium organophilum]
MTSPVSFGALRSFVEVGRRGSIKGAAEALNVTPGAVSQQIKALETRFGVLLLERGHRRVTLSAHGRRLLGEIASSFELIDAAVQLFEHRRPGPSSLVVSTTPSFAACWLTPRLGGFAARHPRIEIRIETSVQLADLAGDRVDIAIRHGSGDYPGLDTALLASPRLVAIGAPALLRDGSLPNLAACLDYPLLQDRDRADWSTWLEAQGAKPGRAAARGPSYADDALLIQAAIAGQGLAVVRDVYAARALGAGSILRAFPASVATTVAYYVVTRPDRTRISRIAAFRDWILAEAAAVT